jgi:DnaJ-domain-containing protein 1
MSKSKQHLAETYARLFKGRPASNDHKLLREFNKIGEAVKYDVEAAVKTIQNFNRGTASDLPNETYLAKQILRDLGYRVTINNVNTVLDHLMASSDGEEIPADMTMVRELIPMLESVS